MRRMDHDARIRKTRQALQFFRLIPDDVEMGDDPLQQQPCRRAALAVLQRRQVGRRDADLLRHRLEALSPPGAKAAQLGAKWRHKAPPRFARRSRTYSAPPPPWPWCASSKPTTKGRRSGMRNHWGTTRRKIPRSSAKGKWLSSRPLPVITSTMLSPRICE